MQKTGFSKPTQYHRSFFHTMLPVIFRIWGLCINLHRFFSGKTVTGVGHRHLHCKSVIFRFVLYLHIPIFKLSITQPIAKGISHRAPIIIRTGISGSHHIILITSLIITVTHINALLINHIVTGFLRYNILGCPFVFGCHIIYHGRCREVIIHIGIYQTAGWIYFAR